MYVGQSEVSRPDSFFFCEPHTQMGEKRDFHLVRSSTSCMTSQT